VNVKDARARETAERLTAALEAKGVEVLYDDRDERPGAKFKDADLLGVPLRVTIGEKGLNEGIVELRDRKSGAVEKVPVADAAEACARRVTEALETPAVPV